MSHFVYFNGDKQSFHFIQGAGSLYFDKEKFSVRRNNIEQIVEEGDGEIINEEIILYKPTITEGVTYKVTGYIQFEIDIYTYNTVDWIVFIYNGSNKYIHKINNKLSPNVIIPINIYSDNLQAITMKCSVPFTKTAGTTFSNLILETTYS